MYLAYLPLWLGIGLIVTYFIGKFLIGAAIVQLFSAPFKMKGKVLANATCTLHGYEWTEKPRHDGSGEDFEDEEPSEPLR